MCCSLVRLLRSEVNGPEKIGSVKGSGDPGQTEDVVFQS